MNDLSLLLRTKAKEYKDKNCIITPSGDIISFQNLLEEIDKAILFYKLNLSHFNNFSIIAPNCPNYLFSLFSLIEIGGCAVNLNPSLSNFEIQERLILGEVSTVITTSNVLKGIKKFLSKTGVKKIVIIDEKEVIFNHPKIISIISMICFKTKNQPDIAFLQFTGGTTGITKAAVLTHRNIIANLQQLNIHFSSYKKLEELHVLITFPFYHIFSLVFNFLFFIINGGTCYMYPDLRDTKEIIRLLKNNPINFTVAVNTWYKKLMQHPDFKYLDTLKIELSLAGGEYVPVSTKNQWESLTKKPLYSAYGLTETCSLSIISPLDKFNEDNSIGKPISNTDVILLDEKNHEILVNNVPGELALKGPQVIKEYYNNPEETRKAFYKGWFRTGDIAERTNGMLYKLVDRKKDMISVSGNKVYPNEVESIISKLEGILDVGVVAKKSIKSGEEVAACVVVHESSKIEDLEIIDYCKAFLSRYKVPKHIYRYKELPKTPIGKTARRILKKEINNEKY